MKVVVLTKEFEEHRCNATTVGPAHWIDSIERAVRTFPAIEPFIPAEAPSYTRVFHCPRCAFVALAPGKDPRDTRRPADL